MIIKKGNTLIPQVADTASRNTTLILPTKKLSKVHYLTQYLPLEELVGCKNCPNKYIAKCQIENLLLYV